MDRNAGRVRARELAGWWPVKSPGAAVWLRAAGIAILVLAAAPLDVFAAACRPKRPLPAIVVTTMGPCNFDPDTFSFAGEPARQAACLVRPVATWAKLGPVLSNLPPVFADRIGHASGLPDRTALAALLTALRLDGRLGNGLLDPISRANDNDPLAPAAKYFVIHDTSGPK